VSLTASSTGCANPRYAFWVQYPDQSWHFVQNFPSANLVWATTGLGAGTYTVHVWVNTQGNGYDAVGSGTVTLTGCTGAMLTPSTLSQAAGTTFNFTASSSGCTTPRYAFWVQYPDSSWHFVQGFGGAAFNWNTQGLKPGTYGIHVWVNQSGNGYDSVGSATATLTGCTSASISPPSGSGAQGTPVTFTASAVGCATPAYEWWIQDPSGKWYWMTFYSTSATWTWNTTGWPKGTYTIHVWANQSGGDMSTYQTVGGGTYSVN